MEYRKRKSGLVALVDIAREHNASAGNIARMKKFSPYVRQVKKIMATDPKGFKKGMWLITENGVNEVLHYLRMKSGEENFSGIGEAVSRMERQSKPGEINRFIFGNSELRTALVDGNIHFVAKDAAKMLGYKRTADAVRQHCKYTQDVGGLRFTDPHNVALDPQTKIIPEPDLWRLIIKSKLPEAEKIEEWVFGEVLPSIRRDGGYISSSADKKQLKDLNRKIDVMSLENQAKTREVAIQQKRGDIAIDEMIDVLSFNSGKVRTCPYCGEQIRKGDPVIGKKIGPKEFTAVCHESCFKKYAEIKIAKKLKGGIF